MIVQTGLLFLKEEKFQFIHVLFLPTLETRPDTEGLQCLHLLQKRCLEGEGGSTAHSPVDIYE